MDAITRLIAAAALRRHKSKRAAYEADVDEWYRAGEGRAPRWITEISPDNTDVRQVNVGGKGYTYPACEYGASRWTDYDNICGPCEDGYSLYELALMEARDAGHEYRKRETVLATLRESRHTFTEDAWKQVQDWAFAPLDPYVREMTEHAHTHTVRTTRWRDGNTWPKPLPVPTFWDREAQAAYDDSWN